MLLEPPDSELKSAHAANVARYRPVPKGVILLVGVLHGVFAIGAAMGLTDMAWVHNPHEALFWQAFAPFAIGYISTVILGIWADVRFDETLYALAIPLLSGFAVIYARTGPNEFEDALLLVAGLGFLGSRLGMYANRIRWDRKVSGGLLPVVFGE